MYGTSNSPTETGRSSDLKKSVTPFTWRFFSVFPRTSPCGLSQTFTFMFQATFVFVSTRRKWSQFFFSFINLWGRPVVFWKYEKKHYSCFSSILWTYLRKWPNLYQSQLTRKIVVHNLLVTPRVTALKNESLWRLWTRYYTRKWHLPH